MNSNDDDRYNGTCFSHPGDSLDADWPPTHPKTLTYCMPLNWSFSVEDVCNGAQCSDRARLSWRQL